MAGHIFQINASNGGVPKHPLREADVTPLGLSVDKVAHPQIHGGPMAALCIFSLERIVALQAKAIRSIPALPARTLRWPDWTGSR